MNKKWNEMTSTEKKMVIAACIYVVIALVFAVLDVTGVWKNDVCTYMMCLFFLVEGVLTWKTNSKMAILSIVLSIVFLLGTF